MHLGACAGLLCILALTAVHGFNVRQAGSCPYNNLIIANGASYATTVNGRCMKYTCNSGTLVESEFACRFDNRCFLEGQTYQKACHEYKCAKTVSSSSTVYSMQIIESNC
ncbi:hypothetical protein BsWGS_06653 [Bradybaena similaris]